MGLNLAGPAGIIVLLFSAAVGCVEPGREIENEYESSKLRFDLKVKVFYVDENEN